MVTEAALLVIMLAGAFVIVCLILAVCMFWDRFVRLWYNVILSDE